MIAAIITTYLVFVFQQAVISYISIGGSTPNLIIILMVTFLFSDFRAHAQVAAGLGGILIDLFSPFRFGLYTALGILIFLICNQFLKRYFSGTTLFTWLGVMLISATIIEFPTLAATLSLQLFVGNIIYTLIFSLIGYGLVSFLKHNRAMRL